MQDNKSVQVGSHIVQDEPIGTQDQLASSHCLLHTAEQTKRKQTQHNKHGPNLCLSTERNTEVVSGSKGMVGREKLMSDQNGAELVPY